MQIKEIKKLVLPIFKPYGIRRAGIFGSAARGEMKTGSDIDILVEIKKDISLLDFIGLKLDLEKALGKKVDLVEYGSIKPALRHNILKDQVEIYGS